MSNELVGANSLKDIGFLLRHSGKNPGQREKLSKAVGKIEAEVAGLNNQNEVFREFSRFFYDPGLMRDAKVKQGSPADSFSETKDQTRRAKKVYTRRSILRMAASDIQNNKQVAFINFDIKKLRPADMVGYGDILINDFVSVLEHFKDFYPQYDVSLARVGGDEFCFYISSDKTNPITESELQTLYDRVKKRLKLYNTYSQQNEKILREEASLKEDKTPIVIAYQKNDLDLFLRIISSGRVPSAEEIRQTNVSKEEHQKIKRKLDKLFHLDLDSNIATLKKRVANMRKRRPEYGEKMQLIEDLIDSKNDAEVSYLGNYLMSVTEDYCIDPLIEQDKNIHSLPDFIDHLKYREKTDQLEKLTFFYNPWLKVLNGDGLVGYDRTDKIIGETYNQLFGQLREVGKIDPQNSKARGRGDFIFITKDFSSGVRVINTQKIITSKQHLFYEGMSLFSATIDYPTTGANAGQVIGAMEEAAREQFYFWLNSQFAGKWSRAQKYIDYYLRERREDRLASFEEWINKEQRQGHKLDDGFVSYITRLSSLQKTG